MCDQCGEPAASTFLQGSSWVCRFCYQSPALMDTCRTFEYGHENPSDPKGSTAHVRDIKARRWHPTEKRLFYYEKPKTYFF